jgi:hypothetical protein
MTTARDGGKVVSLTHRPPLPQGNTPGTHFSWSRDSVVGTATRYGLEGLEIESRWGEISRTSPDRLWGPPRLLYNGYRVFPRGKGGRGVMLTTHPLLVPRLRKSWAISPLTLWVLLGLLRGSIYRYSFLLEAESTPGPSHRVTYFSLHTIL